jgi:hypothetical protein
MFDKLPNDVSELLVHSFREIQPEQVIPLFKHGVEVQVIEDDGYSYPYNRSLQVSPSTTYGIPIHTEYSYDEQPDGSYIVTMVSTQVIQASSIEHAIDQFSFEPGRFTSSVISPEE